MEYKAGEVRAVAIDEILTWPSGDGAKPGKWERLLEEKRTDEHYADVVGSLSARGFVRPLTAAVEETYYSSDTPVFGDGHHRIAAAIDLGLTEVPIEFFAEFSCSEDSGYWYEGDFIPTENAERYAYEEDY